MKHEKLNQQIEELELSDLSLKEVNRTVRAYSKEGMSLRQARKKVRYQLYRLRSEALGQAASVSEPGFKEKFEKQPGFTNWRDFANSWDVAIENPYEVVSRHVSEAEEWDNVVRSKFPQILPGGKIVYPDLKVKERVDAESAKRENK